MTQALSRLTLFLRRLVVALCEVEGEAVSSTLRAWRLRSVSTASGCEVKVSPE